MFASVFGNMVIAYAEAFSWAFQTAVCYWRLKKARG